MENKWQNRVIFYSQQSHLKNLSQNLLAKMRKSKEKNKDDKKLEQEKQNIEKKLFWKDENNSHLRNLNQRLLDQIIRFSDNKMENLEYKNKENKLDNKEELLCLRKHN